LVEESRDTFWIPIDDNEEESSNDTRDWCDLEKLAIEVYKCHVKAYNLCSGHSAKKGDTQDETTPGAEWWVQVKPVGSSKTPVDLHYDKDEALAEAFCLGSFPTLSTVTYLTGRGTDDSQYKDDEMQRGGMDEAPTVVFPHTYHDDEDQPISAMLLSRPVRGKHIVFDGRLLHGAPGHPALRSSQGGGMKLVMMTMKVDVQCELRFWSTFGELVDQQVCIFFRSQYETGYYLPPSRMNNQCF
jgi:hypothetical protein